MVVVLAHLKTVDNTVVNGEGISGDIIGGLPAVTFSLWVVQMCFDNFASHKSQSQTEDINFSFHLRHEFASIIIPSAS